MGWHWLDYHGCYPESLEKVNRYLLKLAIRCVVSMVLGVSLTVIAGYCAGIPTLYTWPGSNAMAVPTAILFLATSLALLALTFLINGHPK